MQFARSLSRGFATAAVCCIVLPAVTPAVFAEIVTLNYGMQFEGEVGKIGSLGEDPLSAAGGAGAISVKQIVLVDDELRRTFIPSKIVQSIQPKQTAMERIKIKQWVYDGNRRIATVGPIIKVEPFDEFGRRVFTMNSAGGPIDVIQGITEITPIYTRVEGLMARSAYRWDTRIATSSIPFETLSRVLMKQIDPKDADQRLRLVRLYIQAERYSDAQRELDGVIKDFPELSNLSKQVEALKQLSARRMIKEIELRKEAGQHRLAYSMLSQFPSAGIAGELLLQVRDMLEEYQKLKTQGEHTLALLDKHFVAIENPATRAEIEPAVNEIKNELNLHTFDRMADYLRLADDSKMSADQKISLAISGWLLGSGAGTDNLAVASALYEVRELVRQYLTTELPFERQQILQQLQTLEGSSPENVSKLLAHMKPAVETSASDEGPVGLYKLSVAGLPEHPDIDYFVQLPPEYDPYRKYPCVLTLNGAGTTPPQQIDWWSGGYSDDAKMRLGQGSRNGYIVIAPAWSKPHQRDYEYSAREHAAALYPLRDACRRFSIDTDRVFLSGHSMGGDAAWDIGLAHPDLWAGVIPIVATADKYVSLYWENGRDVPMYFVAGEMDGDKRIRNAMDLDRYLTKHSFDTIVVEYRGRGHEHYQDEIHRLFEWMNLHRRNFFLREFEVVSMRPWDNYFWWAELDGLPSRSVVVPANWPPPTGTRAALTAGRILENNRILLNTAAEHATVYLSPEMVDFSDRIAVVINRRGRNQVIDPSLEVLLEDVRTRADRQHPFWAKVDSRSSR